MIRRMFKEDLPQVAAIEKECFRLPWSEKGFEDALAGEDNIFLVLEEEGKICGYLGVYVSFEEGEITNVAVASSERNRGFGKSLVKACIQEAAKCGVARLVLEVRVSNASAIHVYESCGFENLGIRKGFYDFPKEDAYIMAYEK